MVTVYGFKKYDIKSDIEVVSRFKATAKRIEEIGAVAIEETKQEVEYFDLESDGVYDPNA